MRRLAGIREFFRSKKIFLLSVVPPVLILIKTWDDYKLPDACEWLDATRYCYSYGEFWAGQSGFLIIFFSILSFLLSLGLLGLLYFLLKKKKAR